MMMKLSIIIPVFNEEKTIVDVFNRVKKVKIGMDKEIIIVDDCSKDNTKEELKKIKDAKIFFHDVNQGKGAAIRTGLQHVTGDVVMIQDADLEYDINEYPKLLDPIKNNEADVVYGSRFMGKYKPKYWTYYMGNKFLTLLTNLLYGSSITDMETCYKVMKADIIKGIKLRARRFDFEPEITAKLMKKRIRILEVPISYECRDFDEGKKISWKDGVKAIYYLMRYRLFD